MQYTYNFNYYIMIYYSMEIWIRRYHFWHIINRTNYYYLQAGNSTYSIFNKFIINIIFNCCHVFHLLRNISIHSNSTVYYLFYICIYSNELNQDIINWFVIGFITYNSYYCSLSIYIYWIIISITSQNSMTMLHSQNRCSSFSGTVL